MEQTSDSGFVGKPFGDKLTNEFVDYVEMPCGGFNRLFRAKRYGKWFVLKGLKPEYSSNPFYQELLDKEFELGMMLSHQNIVIVYGREFDSEVGDCIVMEYVDGMTLSDFLETKPSADAVRKVVSEILSAMSYFHGLQVVHRDIKPSNILVTRNGQNAKIIDFGFSDTDSHAILKQPAGTARYAAPEQYEENVAIDCRADIFSFGMVLKDVIAATKIGGYKAVVRKCTQYDREKRYSNAEGVLKAIAFHRKLRFWVPFGTAVLAVVLALMFAVFFLMNRGLKLENRLDVPDKIVYRDTLYFEKHDSVFVGGRVDTVVTQNRTTYVVDNDHDDLYVKSQDDNASIRIDALLNSIEADMQGETYITAELVAMYKTKAEMLSKRICDSISSQLPKGSSHYQYSKQWENVFNEKWYNRFEKFSSSPSLYDLYKNKIITKERYIEEAKRYMKLGYEYGVINKDFYEKVIESINYLYSVDSF